MAGPLKIYGPARSRAVRTLWMAEELAIPYEHVELPMQGGGHRTPALLAANPNGRVPAIDDGGFPLFESMAINLYLAKKHSAGTLYPAKLEDEARAWQWSFWAVSEVDKPIVDWATQAIVLPEAQRDPVKRDAARATLEPPLQVLEGVLAKSQYLATPGAFSVADLNVASVLYRALAMDLSAKPSIADWLKRCWDRPAARKARAMREA